MEVLFEKKARDKMFEGKTTNYITVHAPSDEDISGKFRQVELLESKNGIIIGKIID